MNTQNAIRKPVVFANGESISIQGSAFHYSIPRKTGVGPFKMVEVGNTTMKLPSRWNVFAEEGGHMGDLDLQVYAWVPVVLVHELIKSNGGIVSGDCPPLALDTYNDRPVN
jgi:hypothetical protein